MILLAIGLTILSALFIYIHYFGTWFTLRRHFSNRRSAHKIDSMPVSILKPLKGMDANLKVNLESFFKLEYPEFELLFSVADSNDPAVSVVRRLIYRYPNVRAKLFIGEMPVGVNPKVRNLAKVYDAARYDIILISDSNTRAESEFLRRAVAKLDDKTGVITASVLGTTTPTLGSRLEAMHLNTFTSRIMAVVDSIDETCVLGKAMLFRKSVAEKFGGLLSLGNYLAEDYMTGVAMRKLGLKVKMMDGFIEQPIGKYSVKDFMSRHIRWGKIRKSHGPAAFVVEILACPLVSSLLLGYFVSEIFGTSFLATFFSAWFFALLADGILVSRTTGRFDLADLAAWFVRDGLWILIWIAALADNSIKWRGNRLKILPGGSVEFAGNKTIGEPKKVYRDGFGTYYTKKFRDLSETYSKVLVGGRNE